MVRLTKAQEKRARELAKRRLERIEKRRRDAYKKYPRKKL